MHAYSDSQMSTKNIFILFSINFNGTKTKLHYKELWIGLSLIDLWHNNYKKYGIEA